MSAAAVIGYRWAAEWEDIDTVIVAGGDELPTAPLPSQRMGPWLDDFLAMPGHHRELLRRYGREHVLRDMRRAAAERRLTSGVAHARRRRVRVAAMMLTFFDEHGVTATTATHTVLEEYIATPGRKLSAEYGFVAWLRRTWINTAISIRTQRTRGEPTITVADDHR